MTDSASNPDNWNELEKNAAAAGGKKIESNAEKAEPRDGAPTGIAAELAKDATTESKPAVDGVEKEEPLQSIAAAESPYKNPYDDPYDATKNYEKKPDRKFDRPNESKSARPSSAATLPSGTDWGIIAGVVTVILVGSVLLFRR